MEKKRKKKKKYDEVYDIIKREERMKEMRDVYILGLLEGSYVMAIAGMSSIELNVKQQGEPTRVQPAQETEKGLYFLSNLDQNIAVPVRTVYCFKSGSRGNEDAAQVIKEALSKILVPYYPMAGTLMISLEGKLIVDNPGEGAVFVEAEADCDIEEIGDLTKPDPDALGKLVYNVPGARSILEMPLMTVQV